MKHSPEKILIVSIPERKLDSASGGFGVAERDGIGVTEREITPDSLLSFDSKIMDIVRTGHRPSRAGRVLLVDVERVIFRHTL